MLLKQLKNISYKQIQSSFENKIPFFISDDSFDIPFVYINDKRPTYTNLLL